MAEEKMGKEEEAVEISLYNALDHKQMTRGKRHAFGFQYDWTPEPVEAWMTDASCVGEDPLLFEFDSDDLDEERLQDALSVCEHCLVRGQCLESSSRSDRKVTVRGGQVPTSLWGKVCIRGHSNWSVRSFGRDKGKKRCLTCHNEQQRAGRMAS